MRVALLTTCILLAGCKKDRPAQIDVDSSPPSPPVTASVAPSATASATPLQLATLCERLRVRMKGEECLSGDDSGEMNSIVIGERPPKGPRIAGTLFCADTKRQYETILSAMRTQFPNSATIGSPRALCGGSFFAQKASKPVQLAEDLRGEIQDFFDSL